MLKGNRTTQHGPKKVSGTSASSHPGCLHQFMIKPSTSEMSAECVLEPRSSLNGSIMSLPDTSAKDKHRNDISSEFGLFQSTKQKTKHCSVTNIYAVFEEDRESEMEQSDCADGDGCERPLSQRHTGDMNMKLKSEKEEDTEPALSETTDQICSLSPTDTNVKTS